MQKKIHDRREQNKLSLQSYFLNRDNIYDNAINRLIAELKDQIVENNKRFNGFIHMMTEDPERYQELNELSLISGDGLDYQQMDTLQDISYLSDQLLSLQEMKVVYAFKFFEITVKNLLRAAYNLSSTKDFYKWEVMIRFLAIKNIEAKSLVGYGEVDQFRKVNNAIKHSDEYEISLSAIPEFKNLEAFTHEKIEQFYERIKKGPNILLQSLIDAIYNDLYVFTQDRIEEVATSLALRLTDCDGTKLIASLSKLYQK